MRLKQILLVILLSVFVNMESLASEQDISIIIDNVKLETDAPYKIVDDHVLVPMRAIFEAMGAEVEWEPKTRKITAIRNNDTIVFYLSGQAATVNGIPFPLYTSPVSSDGKTLVSVRFVVDALGSEVKWDQNTKSVIIKTQEPNYISLSGVKISIGDTISEVENMLGKADRIDPSLYDFKWHVYNSDYSNFIMIGIEKGLVEALYTNSKNFETNDVKYGDVMPDENNGLGTGNLHIRRQRAGNFVEFYLDKFNNNKAYSCIITPRKYPTKELNDSIFNRVQELENFDVTNAFRVNHSKPPLKISELAATTARAHSQDMADNNYFSHTNLQGLRPSDRYRNNGGIGKGVGENITMGFDGLYSLHGWINSQGHRANILSDYDSLGVGVGRSYSGSYMTQLFIRERSY